MINFTVFMIGLPAGYKIGFEGTSGMENILPPIDIGSSGHKKFFIDTMLKAAYRFVDKSVYARTDLEDDMALAGLKPVNNDNVIDDLYGDTAIAERSEEEYLPDRLSVNANIKPVLESFYQLATFLPIDVQERLFSQVLFSIDGAFYYTQNSDSDIRSLHLQPDKLTPIQFNAYIEDNQVKIAHLSYMDLKGEEKKQYGYLFTDFHLDAEGCMELVAGLIPNCISLQSFDDHGFISKIRIGESIDSAIEYTLDYDNLNAIDGLLYGSVFDLESLMQ